jgi:hypothetical protein
MRIATVKLVALIALVSIMPVGLFAQMPDMGAIIQGGQSPAGGAASTPAPATGPTGAPQTAQPPGPAAPDTPAAPQAMATPLQLWHDISLLWVCAQLGITPDQAKRIAGILSGYQDQVAAGAKMRRDAWPEAQAAVEAVLTAWAAGRDPDPQSKAAADAAAKQVQQQQSRTDNALRSAVQAIIQALTEQQRALVESSEEARVVSQMRSRYDGAPSMADYIVQEMTTQRMLMPEEYAAVRTVDASRIAGRLVDSRSDQYPAVRNALLSLFDGASNWNDQQFAAQLPTLPAQVRQYLALTNDTVPKPIAYADLRKWAQDPRTAKYLAIYATAAQPLAPDPETATDELQSALDRAKLLVTFNSLRLSKQQAQQLLTVVAAAKDEVKKLDANKEKLVAPAAGQLQPLLAHMISAKPLGDQWATYLAGLYARMKALDDGLDGQLVPVVEAFRNVLMPQQAALIDWRVPTDVAGGASLQEKAAQKKQQAAQVQEAMNLVKFLRPLDELTFFSLRPARVEEFLSRYMRPGSQQFDRAKEQISDLILQSRAVKFDQWDATLPEVAVQCLQAAGQLRDNQQGGRPAGRGGMDWNGAKDLLLAPETPRALQAMLGMAPQPQPGQPGWAVQPGEPQPAPRIQPAAPPAAPQPQAPDEDEE